MSKISVSVTDGTNVNLTVSPRPVQIITVSRGSTGTGTVTAVTANTPLSVTNGTTTPDLSIAAATDSVSGYLTSTDHATFNAKVGSITSADGSITVTGTTTRDLIVNHSPNVLVEVRNNTGATLTKGTAVYINGAIGQLPTVTKAQANSDDTSAQTLGIMTSDLANNANGYVTIIGLVTNVNTSAYTDGQQLYLSPTVAGGLTATKPSAPQHLVYMAIVEHAHITQGKLFVKVQNGYELDELHDVQIISPTNGQTITYDAATNLWKNTTPTSGGVTSVTATSPVQSTGGTTPVISLPAATTSTSGYLTSTDWNTFNNKQAAGSYLTTVTADSPLTGSGTSASHLSMPVATTSDNGYLSSTDWTTFNNKQATLVSGTNIKTVNSTSLLGSGDVSVGTVTSVGGTGTVSGISLSGTVTNTGSLTLGGSLNLSSPPAIGGTTPNAITGTTINTTVGQTFPAVVNIGNTTGYVQMVDYGDGNDYLNLWTYDGANYLPIICPGGITTGNMYVKGDGTNTGVFQLNSFDNTQHTLIRANSSLATDYTLTLPTTAGSNNQVLKTDGAGNLSWTNKFVLGAGTATAGTAPLKFTSGTNLTTAEAGAMEYDGKVAYFTPSGTARALNFTPYYFRNNAQVTLNDATGHQSVLGLTNGVTLAASTIYEIECEFKLTTSGTTSHTEIFGFAGTATVNNMHVSMDRWVSFVTGSTGRFSYFFTAIQTNTVTGAITTAQEVTYRVRGNISVNASGTFRPVIAFSAAPGGTSTIAAGAWFRVTPLGASGSNISIGTWS